MFIVLELTHKQKRLFGDVFVDVDTLSREVFRSINATHLLGGEAKAKTPHEDLCACST